jgi:formate/nitrite transporter FocA (FNT family)
VGEDLSGVLKGRVIGVGSVPYVTLIKLDFVSGEELAKLVSKATFPMMLFLIVNIAK